MFRINFIRFFRNKINIIAIVLLLLGQLAYSLRFFNTVMEGYTFAKMDMFRAMMRTGKWAFLVFLLIAYRFVRKSNAAGISESIRQIANGTRNVLGNCIMVLGTVCGGYTMILWLINVVFAHIMSCAYWDYVIYMALAHILYIFLFSFVGILIGSCIAYDSSVYRSYFLLGVTVIVFCSEFSNQVLKVRDVSKEDLVYQAAELIQIYARTTESIPDYAYPIALEPVNWEKTMLWIVVFSFLLWLRVEKKKQRIKIVPVMLLVAGFLIWHYKLPSNTYYAFELFDRFDNPNIVRTYYYKMEEEYNLQDILEKERVSFDIEQIDMEVICAREMDVTLRMDFMQTNVEEYWFTFAHDYVIDGLTDENGNAVQYERICDYLVIYNSDKNLEWVDITYHGSNPLQLANEMVISLSPTFPWYPQIGVRYVYDTYKTMYTLQIPENECWYNVKINSNLDVYSNLERVGENQFSGYSQGCLLFAGLGFKEVYVEEARIVYPELVCDEEEICQNYMELLEIYRACGYSLDNKDWYIIPHFGKLGGYTSAFMKECFIGDYEGLISRTTDTAHFFDEIPVYE